MISKKYSKKRHIVGCIEEKYFKAYCNADYSEAHDRNSTSEDIHIFLARQLPGNIEVGVM